MVDQNITPASKPGPTSRRGLIVTALIAVALVIGIAGGFSWRHFGMRDSGGFSLPSPAQIDARIDSVTKQLAVEVGATPEQQAQIATIAKSAAADLRAMAQQEMAARAQAVALLNAPTLDPAGIQRLLTDQIALVDAATKRVGKMLSDAAAVLTVDQRRKLGEWILREGPWARWYRG